MTRLKVGEPVQTGAEDMMVVARKNGMKSREMG